MIAAMPSTGHDLIARVVPRLRKARELDDEASERGRVERWHATLDRSLPTRLVPGLARRFDVARDDSAGFPTYVLTPRDVPVARTLHYLHGGGYMAPIDPFHVRYVTRLATALAARVVLPDYPLAPEHTWRDSHDALVAQADRWAAGPGGSVLAGDSAGGGLALAVAQSLRDRGKATPTHLVLHAPWVDLTTSTPETVEFARRDPWLFLSKLDVYGRWWAGSAEDLARPEVSPALGDLSGLPPAIMLYGTRDLLAPGCRLLRRRAADAGWALTGIEEPDLLHVYGLFPAIPEARRAMRQVTEFLA